MVVRGGWPGLSGGVGEPRLWAGSSRAQHAPWWTRPPLPRCGGQRRPGALLPSRSSIRPAPSPCRRLPASLVLGPWRGHLPRASSPPAPPLPGCIFICHHNDLPQLHCTVSQPHLMSDFLHRRKLFQSKDAVFVAAIAQVPRVPGCRRQETSDPGRERGQLPAPGNVTAARQDPALGTLAPSRSSEPSVPPERPGSTLTSSACEVSTRLCPGSWKWGPGCPSTTCAL